MMIDPGAACANLELMVSRGFLGRYGFYEAADYTPGRNKDRRPKAEDRRNGKKQPAIFLPSVFSL